MIHKTKQLLLTLVALFAMTAGAWADITITWGSAELSSLTDEQLLAGATKTVNGITVTVNAGSNNFIAESPVGAAFSATNDNAFTFSTELGNFTKIECTSVYLRGTLGDGWDGATWTGDANSVNMSNASSDLVVSSITFTIGEPVAPEPGVVTWNAATKTGTFTQPASDVVLTPQYAPVAQWATESDVKLLPTAAEGIFAGTTDPIIVEGTVATGQGTVMYAVTSTNQATAPELSAFSATVPTAENIADEGADVLVWYYIQGADAPDGQEATAENTFNDSEICATPLEVSVLSNQFDITFNAANANTIEAGKATVTVGGTAATVTEGKLEGVKMGSEVKMTAKQGYKFRKVEAKKVAPTLDLATVTTATTVEDGYTLTGTLGASVKISIADGATVTLDGMTIIGANNPSCKWAGITCLGDATIILSGTNTVKGFLDEYPGIYVPQNKTLTIQGSGSLTARSNGMGCGIGAGFQIACGNIVIAGGTITATGGEYSAGIGGGYSGGSCGTISITGGTVTANGGQDGAGIGSGSDGSCGTVTITNGVTSLTATKGGYAPYSIGAGDSGSCGTVTIGCSLDSNGNIISGTGSTGSITTSPYTYQPSN